MEDAEFLDHLKNEPDVSEKEAAIIGVYSIVISVVFFATVFALFTYFQWEVDRMREIRVRGVTNPTYQGVKDEADKGLSDAKVKIDDAIRSLADQGRALKAAPPPAATDAAPVEGN